MSAEATNAAVDAAPNSAAPRSGERTTGELQQLADEVRRRTLACCVAAGTGHVGGATAAVELFTALYFGGVLRYDTTEPRHPSRDRVAVRGHLAPVRYAVFSLLGWVAEEELGGYATLDSRLPGHETTDLPGVDFGPSGSLGMLMSYGLGSAMVAAPRHQPWRTFVFLGDGEEQEGNVAEAARHATAVRARHLVAVIDANGRQLSGPVSHADGADVAATWRGYGWQVLTVEDGNSVTAVRDGLRSAVRGCGSGPVAVIAHTRKGYGIPGAEAHFSGYHELSHCGPEVVRSAIAVPARISGLLVAPAPNDTPMPPAGAPGPRRAAPARVPVEGPWPSSPDDFQLAYLAALAKALGDGHDDRTYFLFADTFPEPLLDRTGLARVATCTNVGVREQHLVALAHGIVQTQPAATVIAHTGDAFVLRAADQIAAAAAAGSRFVLLGDDAGLTNSRNGASHQSSHQPLLMRNIPGLWMLEPADGTDFAAVMNHALTGDGIHYIRVHDGELAEPIDVAPRARTVDSYVVRTATTATPDVLLAATGFLVGEALVAARLLARDGIDATVLNVIAPGRDSAVLAAALRAGVPVLTAYDGHPEVLAQPVREMAGRLGCVPRLTALGFVTGASGHRPELLSRLGLDGPALAAAGRRLIGAADVTASSADRR